MWNYKTKLHLGGLTLRSTRTQPQAAGSYHPGITFASSSLISSAAGGAGYRCALVSFNIQRPGSRSIRAG
jgi:hypothetical protein